MHICISVSSPSMVHRRIMKAIMWKELAVPYAYGMLYGAFLALAVAMTKAYMSPLKRVTIYINLYHEARIEMVFVFFMIIFGAYIAGYIVVEARRKIIARRLMEQLKIDYFE